MSEIKLHQNERHNQMTIDESKRYNIVCAGAILAVLIVLLAAGCTAMPIEDTPTETEWLNANPDLEYGGGAVVVFQNAQDKREFIRQDYPDGYEVYSVVENYPTRIEFTGSAYSTRPLNTYGSIGLQLPLMTLSPGKYIFKVYGDAHLWGVSEDYVLQAHCSIEGVDGIIYLGADDLRANGSYRAMFVLNAPQAGVYSCAVYLHIIHPSMTADSYMTFERITVETAP